jgi:predicted adenine nucleotide alpha hydrolase (AANH) superfamily ATPase
MKNSLFIDVCCGICLLGVFPQLEFENYDICFIFSGDNICCKEEYDKRKEVFFKVCDYYKIQNYLTIPYNHQKYLDFIKGFENEKEGGYRCSLCFEYRFINLFENLIENLKNFQKENYLIKVQPIYFSTTLSVSKYKNYEMIKKAADNFMANFPKKFEKYESKFEKYKIKSEKYENINENENMKIMFYDKSFRNDQLYKNSIKIAKELNLYRQKFCGCEFSKIKG